MNLIKLLTVSIAFISIYMCADADAGDMMTTWTVPTTRVNGTPLQVKEISKYELRGYVSFNMEYLADKILLHFGVKKDETT